MAVALKNKKATRIRTFDNATTVSLYQTDIVRFNGDSITLNSGGYRTVTTKRRMKQASDTFELGFNIWQRDGEWAVFFKGREMPYADRMILDRVTGEVFYPSV